VGIIAPHSRPAARKWWICGLLLLASAINYMDRQTLANAAVRIGTEFHLNQEHYGDLELAFGWAFAAGSLLFGALADRLPVRRLYPLVLVFWSAAGFATGLVNGYGGLLACRTMLGFFEAGHWPCAIRTTRELLSPENRALGNSVLQSGTSVGAIITPLMMTRLMTAELGSWRYAFQVVGVLGLLWVITWFALVRNGDLAPAGASANTGPHKPSGASWRVLYSRRMLVVLFVITCINTTWQLLRAWMPKFLQQGRGYGERETLYFTAAFYVATDLGCVGAGIAALWLNKRGLSVHRSRLIAFAGCAGLTALTCLAAVLPRGWPLLAVLLLVGAGALGLFPIYHALTQDISSEHQGKVTGLAGVVAWGLGSPAQTLFGRHIDRTGSFDRGLAIAGWVPLLAFLALCLFWGKTARRGPTPPEAAQP